MNTDEPLGFFITWTVYGTFLQGDQRGWRKRGKGHQPPQPRLAIWHAARLKFPVIVLNPLQRSVIEAEIKRLVQYRSWHLWKHNVRTNHIHVVVRAPGYVGSKVRDQLKANCTRALRERFQDFQTRPVWSVGGDWKCINSEEELEQIVRYVSEAQDLKFLDDQ